MEHWLWKPEFHIPVENLLDPSVTLGKGPWLLQTPAPLCKLMGLHQINILVCSSFKYR